MPFPLCKIPKLCWIFPLNPLILLRPPPPLLGNFPKFYLVINYDGFPTYLVSQAPDNENKQY